MKKSGPKELKFINYKRYIIVLSVLLTALISINIMFRVSTVFAQAYCTAVYPNVVKVMGAVSSCTVFHNRDSYICGSRHCNICHSPSHNYACT